MKRKVLYIASVYVHIQNFHLPYIRELTRRGWEVDVACRGCPQKIEGAEQVFPVNFKKSFRSIANFREAFRLRRRIAKRQYDLILCHTSLAAFFTRLALLGLRRRPAVCNMVHGYLFDDESPALRRAVLTAAEKITAPVTDQILTMNKYDTMYANKHRLAPSITQINGIGLDTDKLSRETVPGKQEARNILGMPRDAFVLLYAAEFSPRKSQFVLIDAMRGLPENVLLALPGGGELSERCMERARALNVDSRIFCPGYCRNMSVWRAAADVVVSSSRSEGLPFNILEAMHYGLPIVASDVKGHQDLLEHGVNGLLYPYADSATFRKRILWLMDHPKEAAAFGQRSRELVKKYYLPEVFNTVLSLYESTARK